MQNPVGISATLVSFLHTTVSKPNPRRLIYSDGVPQVEQLQAEQAGGHQPRGYQQPDGDAGGREAAQRQWHLRGHPEPAGAAAAAAPAGPGRRPGPAPTATRPGADRSVMKEHDLYLAAVSQVHFGCPGNVFVNSEPVNIGHNVQKSAEK